MGCCSSRREEERVIVIEEIESNGPQAQEPAAGADPNPAAGANPDPANDGIFVVGEIPRAPWEPPKEQERRAGTPPPPVGQIEMGNCAPRNAVNPAVNPVNGRPAAVIGNLVGNGAQHFAVLNRVAQVGDAQPVPNWQPRPQEERRAGTPRAPDGRQRNYVVIPAPALRPMPQDGQRD